MPCPLLASRERNLENRNYPGHAVFAKIRVSLILSILGSKNNMFSDHIFHKIQNTAFLADLNCLALFFPFLPHVSRTSFFPKLWLDNKKICCLIRFFTKSKKLHFWPILGHFRKMAEFLKNWASSLV